MSQITGQGSCKDFHEGKGESMLAAKNTTMSKCLQWLTTLWLRKLYFKLRIVLYIVWWNSTCVSITRNFNAS